MSGSGSYTAIGGLFEYLNSDCGYQKWSQYLIKKLAPLPQGSVGLDMGCGNGYFTRALYRAGYNMTGMDISPQMLSAAVEAARGEGLPIEFLQGDISRFSLPKQVDFITAINDCINYIPPQKLAKTFACVHKNIRRGGMFIFDISAPKKLVEELGNNLIVKDFPKATLIWYNTLKEDRVEMDLTLFVLGPDGKYTRADEEQTQYIHTEKSITEALSAAGFEVNTEGHISGKAQRINFICKKL